LDADVDIEIIRDGKAVKMLDVEREYEEWIKEMHDLFDEEVNLMSDTDGKILTLTLKELGFSQEGWLSVQKLNFLQHLLKPFRLMLISFFEVPTFFSKLYFHNAPAR
jgi:hypothetical protein